MKHVAQMVLDIAYDDYMEVSAFHDAIIELSKVTKADIKVPCQEFTTEDVTDDYKMIGDIAFVDGTSETL